ncbi:hypothetical protein 65p261 [Aeromonas phage 65]|uniref:Uncharacterized protein n=1 Tax=Aeromonas phage 65 TaxID=2919549 RepID=E5DS95_9CAUD|nr:hypothetical protein ST65p261 [Aeromonas phage 65]ADQ53269.1 hypothetical protein 65p261 [Aeromonas phage 65]
MNEEIVYAPNDGIYIGCEMVCVETVRFHGYIAIDVGTKVVVNGYDGVDLIIATDTANHPLNPFGEWKLPKKYFKLIEHNKEPTPFSFKTNSQFYYCSANEECTFPMLVMVYLKCGVMIILKLYGHIKKKKF